MTEKFICISYDRFTEKYMPIREEDRTRGFRGRFDAPKEKKNQDNYELFVSHRDVASQFFSQGPPPD